MKTTLKRIALGTLVFLLFSQFSFKKNELVGLYKNSGPKGYMTLTLKNNNKCVQKIRGCYKLNISGEWKLKDDKVLCFFKNRRGGISSDTLIIKRLNTKIDSLGIYKKL